MLTSLRNVDVPAAAAAEPIARLWSAQGARRPLRAPSAPRAHVSAGPCGAPRAGCWLWCSPRRWRRLRGNRTNARGAAFSESMGTGVGCSCGASCRHARASAPTHRCAAGQDQGGGERGEEQLVRSAYEEERRGAAGDALRGCAGSAIERATRQRRTAA